MRKRCVVCDEFTYDPLLVRTTVIDGLLYYIVLCPFHLNDPIARGLSFGEILGTVAGVNEYLIPIPTFPLPFHPPTLPEDIT